MPNANIRRYLRNGTLPQLTLFEASARLGSFTRAAQELHMAQPTASLQIKKLTQTVGLPLFEQIGKRIYLTDAGHILQQSCCEVFRALANLEDALAAVRGVQGGRLRLAVNTAAKFFVPAMLAEFVRVHPGVEVTLQVENHDGLQQRLASNLDDLYLFADAPDAQEYVTQAIFPDALMVFARDDHPLAAARRIPFANLAQEPFLMREPGSGTRHTVECLFAQSGLQARAHLELGSDESICQAIVDGLGISILSPNALGTAGDQSRLVHLDVIGFPLERIWHFVYPVGKQLSSAALAFMDLARKRGHRGAHSLAAGISTTAPARPQ